MAMKRQLALMLGVVFAVVMFLPINGAVTENTGSQDVTNETFAADPGTYQDLNGYDIEDNSETVYWFNSTSGNYEEVTSGSDYEINNSAGTIKFLTSGEVGDGDDVKVSYTWQQTEQTTTTVVTLIPLLLGVLIIGKLGNELTQMT